MDFKILLEKITPALKAIARKRLLYSFYSEEDLYQEMCLFLWSRYKDGMPIGFNESYIIKACEFHMLNFLRKGRPKVMLMSLDEPITSEGLRLEDILEDKKDTFSESADRNISIDDIKNIGLTPKENNVFSLLLKGYTVREAAQELGISHVMVLKYKKNIIRKWVTKSKKNLL
ncbi:MAG: sigma-70 family RNA polymerase sigma factor [Candidatus Omnitrophota bacterium]